MSTLGGRKVLLVLGVWKSAELPRFGRAERLAGLRGPISPKLFGKRLSRADQAVFVDEIKLFLGEDWVMVPERSVFFGVFSGFWERQDHYCSDNRFWV
jgi:hypothetical protein